MNNVEAFKMNLLSFVFQGVMDSSTVYATFLTSIYVDCSSFACSAMLIVPTLDAIEP